MRGMRQLGWSPRSSTQLSEYTERGNCIAIREASVGDMFLAVESLVAQLLLIGIGDGGVGGLFCRVAGMCMKARTLRIHFNVRCALGLRN